MFEHIGIGNLEILYPTQLRFKSVESVLDVLSEDAYNAVQLLRFTRYRLRCAAMKERQFKALNFASILVEAGVESSIAEKIEHCFEDQFDFNSYLSMAHFEVLEMFLIKRDIVSSALDAA